MNLSLREIHRLLVPGEPCVLQGILEVDEEGQGAEQDGRERGSPDRMRC